MTILDNPAAVDADTYLDRARTAATVIEAEANAIEEAATITTPVFEALSEAGLFWALVPKQYGGAGLDIVTTFKIIQEISRADGSTGWAFMANACSTGVAVGFMDPVGAEEIFGGELKGITAGMIVPTGRGVRVDGGFRIDGRFQFASGSAHASWIGVGFVVHDENGEPVIDDDGQPDCRIAFVPRDQVEFLGNWDVMGMVGTGSYDYQVADCFAADRFTMKTFSTTPTQPEPVYELGLLGIGVGGHAPVALGLAERALQEIAGILETKVRPGYDGVVGDSDVFRLEFGRREALFRAAQAYVYEVYGDAEATAARGETITAEQRARMRQTATWAQEVAGDVVMFAHRWAGSATVRNPSALGRCVRDAAVATQHALIDRMTIAEAAADILPAYRRAR
ncbi:acyl-CoA dehydrogenase family protein [Gordonia hydrophobica]|uniref:Acyl-CoA dehydrogenase family protein n=1 Tax=Gordonia hydrophobica TaxID=40516 RepID=A0ABZ2U2M8_9ACTN|nr:acyl-CoA dehydrogenase family protein [Gordonia hydrophobica]MBM7369000.1 alkylation response protein AidB-like acyl-CoA dehydrogenase [Gordonia hydrophobica]